MRWIILPFALVYSISSLSQEKCILIKGNDNKPVEYASVMLKGRHGTSISNQQGLLCYPSGSGLKTGDTVLISAVGYESKQFVYEGIDTILLERLIRVLPEVILVDGKGKEETWGTKSNPRPFLGYFCSLSFREILNSYGRLIFPEGGTFRKAEIESVSFYDQVGKGINVPVRLRIYLLGNDSLPKADYLNDNIIVKTGGKGWLTIDLKDRGLVMPKEGLAFFIELFANEPGYYYKEKERDENGNVYEASVYGFAMGAERVPGELTLTKFNEWDRYRKFQFGPECTNLVCRVKVKVWR